MTLCFLGTSFLKKYEYYWSNIFQFISLLVFLLLFLLFDFHTGEELSKNYTSLEIAVLVISYIFLCASVGASSSIALGEFVKLYKYFYQRHFDIWNAVSFRFLKDKCCKEEDIKNEKSFALAIFKFLWYALNDRCCREKINEDNDDDNLEKFLFALFSLLSSVAIIALNRLIFYSIEDITSTKLLISILMVYVGSLVLSIIFYIFYSIPSLSYNNQKKETEKEKENETKDEKNNNNGNRKINLIETNNIKSGEHLILYNKLNNQDNVNNVPNENKIEISHNINISNNNGIIKKENKIIDDKDTRKSCTCIGYVFFQKKINNKIVCIFYDYDTCCSWFCLKLRNPQIFAPLITEFFLQLSCVGFNSVISDKLSNEFSISKNIKFFCWLFFVLFFLSVYIIFFRIISDIDENNYDNKEQDKNKKKNDFCINNIFIYYFIIGINFFINVCRPKRS